MENEDIYIYACNLVNNSYNNLKNLIKYNNNFFINNLYDILKHYIYLLFNRIVFRNIYNSIHFKNYNKI